MAAEPPAGSTACSRCGTEVAPGLLACPSCQALVHAARLRELSDQAARASADDDLPTALAAWREALALLPPASRQFAQVQARAAELSRQLETRGPVPGQPRAAGDWRQATAGLGVLGVLIWKLKAGLQLLLAGATKGSTLFSMLLAFGVYWTAFRWWFALGLVVSIYVHEMGHVAALRRYGLSAGAPMFIPGLGAFVRLHQAPVSYRENARIGLAGPWWGLAAAVAFAVAHWVTGNAALAAIARIGAWIDLFNLLPVWQLDGSHGFAALARAGRWLVLLLAVGGIVATGEGLLVLFAILWLARSLTDPPPAEPDPQAATQFALLLVALTALTRLPVPGVPGIP